MNTKVLEPYSGKKIVITGALGFLGSALTAALATIDCELHLVDIAATATWLPQNSVAKIIYHQGSVAEAATWQQALPHIDYVFHLAAVEKPYQSDQDIIQEYLINTASLLHFFTAAAANQSKPALIFSSSANLFWGNENKPVSE